MKKLLKFGLMSVWGCSVSAILFVAAFKGYGVISTAEFVLYSLTSWTWFITSTIALIKIEEAEGK